MNQPSDPVNELRAIGYLLADCQAHLSVCVDAAERLGFPILAAALQRSLDALHAADEENFRFFMEMRNVAY